MAVAHDLRELAWRLTEIASVAHVPLPLSKALLDLLALFEPLLHLLDVLAAPAFERAAASLALRAQRVRVDLLLLLEPRAAVELGTSRELLVSRLRPRLRHERRTLRMLRTRFVVRALLVGGLMIVARLLVIRTVARAGDRGRRRHARQQKRNEKLTHNSDLSKTLHELCAF
jgi:hypothetical protein